MWDLKATLLVVICIASCVLGDHEEYSGVHNSYEGPTVYSFEQIYKLIMKSVKCLERYHTLSPNATFAVCQAVGFLHEVFPTVPNFSGPKKDMILEIERRLEPFIHRGIAANPNDITTITWLPYYYGDKGDFTFQAGRVPKFSPLGKTLSEIVAESHFSDFVQKCVYDLFLKNGQSFEMRECVAVCENEMTNLDYDSRVSPEMKSWHIGYEMVLNCTNSRRQLYEDMVVHNCVYVKRELDTMGLFRRTEQFQDTFYYYARKAVYCAAWGLPEFLSPKIIKAFVNKIDCNGCVALEGSIEDNQVLTAQTIGMLGLMLRYSVQKEYNIGNI